jgi:hypothetical protein
MLAHPCGEVLGGPEVKDKGRPDEAHPYPRILKLPPVWSKSSPCGDFFANPLKFRDERGSIQVALTMSARGTNPLA